MYFDLIANKENIKNLARNNIVNNIATFSVYRFWARANLRQFLWAKTRLDNEPFEFRGTGNELFKGFWMALIGIFAPFYIINLIVEFSGNMIIGASFGLITYLFFAFITGYGIWRARSYILARTYWRGINFGLAKGAFPFAIKFVVHSFLLILTLGWWHPNMRKSISKQLWSNTYWGNVKFQYRKPPELKGLYGRFAIGYLATIIITLFALFIASIVFAGSVAMMNIDNSPAIATLFGYLVLALLWWIASFGFGSYRAATLRYVASCIRIDDARINLTIDGSEFFHLTIKNALLTIITLGLAAPYTQLNYFTRILAFMSVEMPPQGIRKIYDAQHQSDGSAQGIDDAFELPFFDMSPI